MKIRKIKDRKYYRSVYLITEAKPNEFVQYFKKKYPQAEEFNFPKYEAHFFSVINDEYGVEDFYICINKFDWCISYMGLLAHEVLHLSFEVLKRVGMKYSGDSEEAYAYYFDGMLQEFMEALKPKK